MNKYAMTGALHMPIMQARRVHAMGVAGTRWFLVPLFAMIGFGLLYVFIVNRTASQGYQVRELESKIEQLERETKSLELQAAELQSMESIGSRVVGMEFVPVAQVRYLRAGTPAVARK